MFDNLSLVHAGCLEGEQLIFIVSVLWLQDPVGLCR